MAKITSKAIDETVQALAKKRNEIGEFFTQALEQSSEIAKKEIVKQIKAFDVIDKGMLVKAVEGEMGKDGYSVEIYPQKRRVDKKHRKGERNETIAFVNEYGRKHRYYSAEKFNRRGAYIGSVKRKDTKNAAKNAYEGRPFMQTAYEQAADDIEKAILDTLGGALNE